MILEREIGKTGLEVRRIAPAYEQVAEQLREQILRGDLVPGERLPNESELSTMFGVSRSTIREAIRVLSSGNLLATSRGVRGGHFVAHPQPEEISESLEAAIGLLTGTDAVSVGDLLEARALLEVPAARLAAERRTDTQLRDLRKVLRHEHGIVDRSHGFEEHRRFHQSILEASGNALVEIVTRPIFMVLRTRFLRDEAPSAFWATVAADHQQIYERVEAADGDGAATAMLTHLTHLAATYEKIDRQARRASGVTPRTR